MKPIVKNNFLPKFIHKQFINEIVNNTDFPWFYSEDSSMYPKNISCNSVHLVGRQFGFQHNAYMKNMGESMAYPMLKPMIGAIEEMFDIKVNDLLRIRLGMSVNVGESGSHRPHTDYDSDHKTLLYYINDSDGDTIFYKEYATDENIENLSIYSRNTPVANQAVLFDGLQYHNSSAPTKNNKRITININFN